MPLASVSGKGEGRFPITTRTPQWPDLRPYLVGRDFKALGPYKLWVADITYVRTKKSFVDSAFVRYLLPTDRWVGVIRLDAHPSVAAAGSQPGDRVC